MINEKQTPGLTPGVSTEMLKADFWIKRLNAPGKVILTAKEKKKFHSRSLQRAEEKNLTFEYCNLKDYPGQISSDYLQEIMKQFSDPAKLLNTEYYNYAGKEIEESFKKEIASRCNLENCKGEINVKWGIMVKRDNIRAFPTDEVFAGQPETIDQDLMQLTTISVGTPLAILHTSLDNNWYFIQAPRYRGWVKTETVALAKNRRKALVYREFKDFLVVTGSRVETEPNPFLEDISNIMFQMGDKIPLLPDNEIPLSIPPSNQQAQSPEGCYTVKIPVRDKNGQLNYRPALLALHHDVNRGYLPYTRANLLKQSFKMLGERYGWGGLYQRRDCSRFIVDIYGSVGIIIPRDAGRPQEEIPAGKTVVFEGNLTRRKKIMEKLEPGDPIYMKGHVVMYLGQTGNEHFVIHSGSGYGIKDKDGQHQPRTVHGVFVMNVNQLLKSESKTYLEAFKLARRFNNT